MRIKSHGRQHNGIVVWNELYTAFHRKGGQDLEIELHKNTLMTKFSSAYPNGLIGFVEASIDANNGLHDHNVEYGDQAMKERLLQNAWNPETACMIDSIKMSPNLLMNGATL